MSETTDPTAGEHPVDYDALLRLAQHLSSRDIDHWSRPRCELAGNNNLARCPGDAVGTRWEDGFADLVCEEHAANAEARGALFVRAHRHDGTHRVIPPAVPAAPDVAGERCSDCGHAEDLHYALGHVGCHGLACACKRVPATPDAGDASECDHLTTMFIEGTGWRCYYCGTPVDPDAPAAGTDASEGLSEDERRAVNRALDGIACDYGTAADLHAVVERIVAAREAAARAEERERIAQAIEAGRTSRPVGVSPTEHAASIARGDAR